MQMGKKRFRPRARGGRGGSGYGGGGGGGGGGYYQGGNGQGQNGRVRRRRHFHDRQDRPPFGGEASPESQQPPQPQLDESGNPLPMPEGGWPLAPVATETPLEPGHGLLEMHPNGYGFL